MRITSSKALLAGVLAAVLAGPQPALALKVLTEENPPLNYTEGKKLIGVATAVVREMGHRAKIKFDFEVMAWNKAYERAQADKETCLYSTARLANRENLFKWVGPIATNKWGLFALGAFTPQIKSLDDAKPFRIGGVARDAKTEFLKQWGVTNIFEVEDDRLNPGKLTLDRKEAQKIDLWITSVSTAERVAERAKVPGVKLVYLVREEESFLACSPRTSANTLKALAAALDEMKKDSAYREIVKAYERR